MMTRHEIALKKLAEGTVIPATPLALDENRQLNEKGLRLLINYYLACGVGGIATAVHTTQFEIRKPEFALLEPVLKIVSDEINNYEKEHKTVIVKIAGVCGPTAQAAEEARLAKKHGYDAVLLSPGGLNHLSEDEMIARTKEVAKIMPVIGFYLQTAVGGRVFSYQYWERLCAIDNVVAIKCASFNRYTTLDVVRAAAVSERSEQITLYTGNDDNIVIDLLTNYRFDKNGTLVTKGFEGGLLGHWTMWTQNVVQMFKTLKDAKGKETIPAELLTLAAQVTDANAAFFDASNGFAGCIPGVHELLRRQGLMENIYCLNPNEVLSSGQAEEIERVCKAYPHLNDDEFISSHLDEWKKKISFSS